MLRFKADCIALIVIVLLASADSARPRKGRRPVPDEQRLIREVFENYDNNVRPVFNATKNVVVEFGLTLVQILDMDEKNQILITNVWLEHIWHDERMKWDPKNYSNLSILRIPVKKLWMPDIVLYNNADDYTTGYMPSNAMIHHDGRVVWGPPSRLRSSCKVDITLFPFDSQQCSLKFGSWTYDRAQVDMVSKSTWVMNNSYMENGEWELMSSRVQRNDNVYPIGPEVYPDITVSVTIRRRIIYYILNILLPCFWLNVISLLAFCLPPDAGEKITLGITVLLSYSIFMLLVAENMPSTSEFVPLIGIYLSISMAVTSVSIILTVWVLKLHHPGPHQREMPNWLRVFVLHRLARLMRCRCTVRCNDMRKRRRRQSTSGARPIATNHIDSTEACLRLISDMNKHSPVAELRSAGLLRRPAGGMAGYANGGAGASPAATTTTTADSSELRRVIVMEQILQNLKLLVEKKDADEQQDAIVKEWQEVAAVFDRLLFVVFFFITICTILTLIVFIPYFRYT